MVKPKPVEQTAEEKALRKALVTLKKKLTEKEAILGKTRVPYFRCKRVYFPPLTAFRS